MSTPAIEQLSEAERADALDGLPEWDYDESRDAITRSIVFTDFAEAFGFMAQVAILAERMAPGDVQASQRAAEQWIAAHPSQ